MGGLLSRLRRTDYDLVLKQLDNQICDLENDVSGLVKTEARVKSILLIYTTLLCLGGAVVLYYAFHEPLWATLLAGVYPSLLWTSYRTCTVVFRRSRHAKDAKIQRLKRQLAIKLDDLKKETSFNFTKDLVERYDRARGDCPPAEKEMHAPSGDMHGQTMMPLDHGIERKLESRETSEAPTWTHAFAADTQHVELAGSCTGSNPEELQLGYMAKPHAISPGTAQGIPLPTPDFYLYYPKSWVDRIVDRILGSEDERTSKYAIICKRCFFHNGLVLPGEVGRVAFFCARCNFYNFPEDRTVSEGSVLSDPSPQDQARSSEHAESRDTVTPEVENKDPTGRHDSKPISEHSIAPEGEEATPSESSPDSKLSRARNAVSQEASTSNEGPSRASPHEQETKKKDLDHGRSIKKRPVGRRKVRNFA